MKTKITSFIAATLIAASCSSGFMEEYSQDLSRVKSAEDLNELLMGDCTMPLGLFYLSYSQIYIENENYAMLHFLGDELKETLDNDIQPEGFYAVQPYFGLWTWQRDVYLNDEGASTYTSDEEHYWNLAYEKINNCNMVIEAAEELSTSNDKDEALRQHVMGECHFIRASYYAMLVNLYAKPYAPSNAAATPGVPVKTTGEVVDEEFQRNSVAEVYQQILADLDEAERLLADVTSPQTIYHVGINAVYVFRSRMALYMQDWASAKAYAEKALAVSDYLQEMRGWADNAYPLSDKNKEVIYSNGSSCFGNLIFQNPGKEPSYYWYNYSPVFSVSDNLVALYDDNDGRKSGYITDKDDVSNDPANWTYHKIDNSVASFGVYKTVSDVFSIRTAEAYLNLAEAEAQLRNDAAACSWLNKLRATRIDGDAAVNLSGEQLISFIRDERQRELCFEGHRWFDLRRYQVDAAYPYSKAIEHSYTWYVLDGYDHVADHTSYYRLEPNDDAYTLNIPKNVRDFQNSIGSNPRPERPAFETVNRRE